MFQSRKRHQVKGFTLVELLIVMVILGLLASLVAPKMFGKVASSKVQTAKTQMELLSTALDMYKLDVGRYPTQLSELLTSDNNNWQGPYLPKEIPNDPWGNPYYFKYPGENAEYDLISYGSDGNAGGKDEATDVVY
ncbi:type II secretion system major pseudopilin GspG [Thalassotalea profundi]|uniref:type II secretion system major pseudopilin GspG n=1 Tax=Thalassotalea profundi TaxID=2036687 RepID=UPI001678D1A0|nr:type II secretion system major pseudopilin GspG [Thalassotalea profundi]